MGTFSTEVRIQNLHDRNKKVTVSQALVGSGSEYTWIDIRLLESIGVQRENRGLTFTMANGEQITRTMVLQSCGAAVS